MTSKSNVPHTFETENDFCSNCGAILQLKEDSINSVCVVCHQKISIKNMFSVQTKYEIEFTPLSYYSNLKSKNKMEHQLKDEHETAGQMDNDRDCSKCGNRGMSYTTMQLRSADEGQTIFYLCPLCKHREVENS